MRYSTQHKEGTRPRIINPPDDASSATKPTSRVHTVPGTNLPQEEARYSMIIIS